MAAVNETRNVVLAERTSRALWPAERMKGLLGRQDLPQGEALLIRPCRSVHTFFMRFSIDVAFLDPGGEVVAVLERMPPWRASRIYLRARSALELPSGTLARTGTRPGDRVVIGGMPP